MKLATYQDGSRDGHLVVVSRDLATAVYANTQATRLQQLLDDWNFVAPQLHDLYLTLNHGKSRHAFAFDPAQCMAPLPRVGSWAWQALDGDAASARRTGSAGKSGADAPSPGTAPQDDASAESPIDEPAADADSGAPTPRRRAQPVLQSGAGDDMHGPRAELDLPDDRGPARVAAGVAVFTGELALGAGPSQALEAIRLLGLYTRWTLAPTDLSAAEALLTPHWAPVLVTPDELGPAWSGGRIDLPLQLQWLRNSARTRQGPALTAPGRQQRWHYGQLLASVARTRRVRAGAVFGCDWLTETLPATADLLGDAATRALTDGAALDLVGRDGLSVFDRLTPTWAPPAAPQRGTTAHAPATPDGSVQSAASDAGAASLDDNTTPDAATPAAAAPSQRATDAGAAQGVADTPDLPPATTAPGQATA
jgi:fumarylacetoacetate (FAA) hydrolase